MAELIPPLTTETLAAWKNDPLPDSDALIARPWLLAAEKELARLDSRRSALFAQMQVYRVALAPYKNLPIEVLSEIFLWAAAESSPVYLHSLHFHRMCMQLILCQVCSHWRSVALHTHKLWSDVRVRFKPETTTRLLEILDIWLSRSDQCSLTFFVEIIGAVDDSRIGQWLNRYSNRLRFITFLSTRPSHINTFPAGSLNILEKLMIEFSGLEAPWPLAPITFDGAVRLRSLTLQGLYTLNLQLLAIPWHQLTELYLLRTPHPPSQYHSILDGCKDLTTAHLAVRLAPDGPFPIEERNIALPQLRTLKLAEGDLTSYAICLHGFELPSLLDLSLVVEHVAPTGAATSVRAYPTVRALYVVDDFDDPMLVPWLRACPSVMEVRLPFYVVPDSILSEIADGSLLPNVEQLVAWQANPGLMISTLQARQRSMQYSTISEVGLSRSPSMRLETQEIELVSQLMAVGVFLAHSPKLKPERGEIEKYARVQYETSSGPFYSSSESDSESQSDLLD
ncbi:hypothetical protein C8R44DRAFT_863117 [Mycena epipterygia]|nr:hypothetical protein C8R44DRAFT_863117 [Mycena epipterygia]